MQYETFPKISRPKNHIFFLYTVHKYEHLPHLFPVSYPLPHHGEKFFTKKRRIVISNLGVITLQYGVKHWSTAYQSKSLMEAGKS